MNVWLALATAVLLIPVARLFMANGCGSSTPPPPPPPRAHGSQSMRITVDVDNHNPRGFPEGDARITGGSVPISSPTGRSHSVTIPPGGLFDHAIIPEDADFPAGGTFNWTLNPAVSIEATQPIPGTPVFDHASFDWDARAERRVHFVVRLEEYVVEAGSSVSTERRELRWALSRAS